MNVQAVFVKGGAAVTGTALLAAAMWLYATRPEVRAKELDPIRTGGEIGAIVTTPDFRVQVEGVVAARSIAPSTSLGKPESTEGIFLIVRYRAASQKGPLKLRTAVLETPGGFTYRPGPRVAAGTSAAPEFQPMIWTKSVHVFEIPRKAAEGARFVTGTGGLLPQLSAAAEIDLGLTPSKAAQLVQGAAEAYDPRTERP
jgi:hypothetical protein